MDRVDSDEGRESVGVYPRIAGLLSRPNMASESVKGRIPTSALRIEPSPEPTLLVAAILARDDCVV